LREKTIRLLEFSLGWLASQLDLVIRAESQVCESMAAMDQVEGLDALGKRG
jgi:hypothetical protein